MDDQLPSGDYIASAEELEIIDSAVAAVDRGEVASEADVEAAFGRFAQK